MSHHGSKRERIVTRESFAGPGFADTWTLKRDRSKLSEGFAGNRRRRVRCGSSLSDPITSHRESLKIKKPELNAAPRA